MLLYASSTHGVLLEHVNLSFSCLTDLPDLHNESQLQKWLCKQQCVAYSQSDEDDRPQLTWW